MNINGMPMMMNKGDKIYCECPECREFYIKNNIAHLNNAYGHTEDIADWSTDGQITIETMSSTDTRYSLNNNQNQNNHNGNGHMGSGKDKKDKSDILRQLKIVD